jgi:hypothetical protein
MEGFKLLVEWLAPIHIPSYEVRAIPKLHRNYELNEIAKILNCHPSIVYQTYQELL